MRVPELTMPVDDRALPLAAVVEPRRDLAGLGFAAFASWCKALVGHHRDDHRSAYRHLLQTGTWDPHALACWREADRVRPGTLARLCAAATPRQMPEVISARQVDDPIHGQTTKLLVRLDDTREVETVLIPMQGGSHHTLCVSSQVGCKMGCTFCQTARMGLVRQLQAHEIIGQLLAVEAHTGLRARNVVFMGMGEPLDNIEAVAAAVDVLTDHHGLALAARRVTVSTVGRVDMIRRLSEFGLQRINLAVSLTAADDTLRSSLMPVNRIYNLAALKTALLEHPLPRHRHLLISYVLIAGVNDTDAHACALRAWLSGLRVVVNVIPLNPIPGDGRTAPPPAAITSFISIVTGGGIVVRIRGTKGDAVMAACGQLGTASGRRPREDLTDQGSPDHS